MAGLLQIGDSLLSEEGTPQTLLRDFGLDYFTYAGNLP